MDWKLETWADCDHRVSEPVRFVQQLPAAER